MRGIKLSLLILVSIFLISCSTHQMYFPTMAKAGVTDQQKKKDALECKMKASEFRGNMAMGGAPSFGAVGMIRHKKEMNEATDAANEFYVQCMEERGYVQ